MRFPRLCSARRTRLREEFTVRRLCHLSAQSNIVHVCLKFTIFASCSRSVMFIIKLFLTAFSYSRSPGKFCTRARFNHAHSELFFFCSLRLYTAAQPLLVCYSQYCFSIQRVSNSSILVLTVYHFGTFVPFVQARRVLPIIGVGVIE